jgi:hypothetical protein
MLKRERKDEFSADDDLGRVMKRLKLGGDEEEEESSSQSTRVTIQKRLRVSAEESESFSKRMRSLNPSPSSLVSSLSLSQNSIDLRSLHMERRRRLESGDNHSNLPCARPTPSAKAFFSVENEGGGGHDPSS